MYWEIGKLINMRAFFNFFPIWNAVRTELSWTHYRIISRIDNPDHRIQYVIIPLKETGIPEHCNEILIASIWAGY